MVKFYTGNTPDYIHEMARKMHAYRIRKNGIPDPFRCVSIDDVPKLNVGEGFLLRAATRIMNELGFKVRNKRREILFEHHMYSVNGPVETMIGLHRDNHSGVDGKVHTMIIFIKKDEQIKGGNFIYIDDDSKEVIVETKPGMFIIIDGDLEHTPQSLNGSGVRSSIVIQIEQS